MPLKRLDDGRVRAVAGRVVLREKLEDRRVGRVAGVFEARLNKPLLGAVPAALNSDGVIAAVGVGVPKLLNLVPAVAAVGPVLKSLLLVAVGRLKLNDAALGVGGVLKRDDEGVRRRRRRRGGGFLKFLNAPGVGRAVGPPNVLNRDRGVLKRPDRGVAAVLNDFEDILELLNNESEGRRGRRTTPRRGRRTTPRRGGRLKSLKSLHADRRRRGGPGVLKSFLDVVAAVLNRPAAVGVVLKVEMFEGRRRRRRRKDVDDLKIPRGGIGRLTVLKGVLFPSLVKQLLSCNLLGSSPIHVGTV